MPRPEPRQSPRSQRLEEQGQRQAIRTSRSAERNANSSNMLQQLSTLYGLGQESEMAPIKQQAGQLANQRAQTELGFLPGQNEAALAESAARTAENKAQTDYYGIRGQAEQAPDPRVLPYIQDPNNIPDWMIPFMPKESQEVLRAKSAQKQVEKQAALEREAKIASGTGGGVAPPAGASAVQSGQAVRNLPTTLGQMFQDNATGGFAAGVLGFDPAKDYSLTPQQARNPAFSKDPITQLLRYLGIQN